MKTARQWPKVVLMRLTIIGSAGSYGSAGISCSCYLLQDRSTSIVLDIGNGSFSLLAGRIEPGEIDALFISHRHHDHLADLISFYHYLLFVPGARRKRPLLLASRETFDALALIFAVDLAGIFELKIVAGGESVVVGSMRMEFAVADHIEGTLATKVIGDAAQIIGYSADTAVTPSLVSFFAGVDLLLGESTWLERPGGISGGLHMTAEELAGMARAAGVRELVVTHVAFPATASAAAELARATFDGRVIAAEDGLVIDLEARANPDLP